MKASTALSPCQPLGQSGNAKPPSSTTSGGISGTHSPKLLPTRPSCSAPLQLSPLLPPLSHPPLNPPPPPHPQSPNPGPCIAPTLAMVCSCTVAHTATSQRSATH